MCTPSCFCSPNVYHCASIVITKSHNHGGDHVLGPYFLKQKTSREVDMESKGGSVEKPERKYYARRKIFACRAIRSKQRNMRTFTYYSCIDVQMASFLRKRPSGECGAAEKSESCRGEFFPEVSAAVFRRCQGHTYLFFLPTNPFLISATLAHFYLQAVKEWLYWLVFDRDPETFMKCLEEVVTVVSLVTVNV